ncbi:MAG: hypothetical protein RLZZ444_117 [Pseudomonadota bacterium]
MAVDDIIQTYLQAYASSAEDVVYLARVSDDSWQMDFEDDLSILFELNIVGATLGIVARLGVPSANRRLTVYGALLNFSALWQQTGGVRGALDGADGALLIGELDLERLTETGLLQGLEAIRSHARLFVELITTDTAGVDDVNADDMMMLKI